MSVRERHNGRFFYREQASCMTARQVIRKQRIKNGVYRVLGSTTYLSGLTWIRKVVCTSSSLRILIYYKINEVPGNILSTSAQTFLQQLRFLNDRYTVISPEQLTSVMVDGATLPGNAVLVTFDDGYRDVYENAYPILKEMGLKAMIFPSTDYIGTATRFPHDERLPMPNPVLDWSELRRMQDVFTIGSHTQSHRVLTTLPAHIAKEEIFASKKILEDRIGCAIRFFCYPKGGAGQFSQSLEDMVQEAGYIASFVTLTGPNNLESVRRGKWLRRFHAEPFNGFMFARLMDGSCDAIGFKDTLWGGSARRVFNSVLGTTTR